MQLNDLTDDQIQAVADYFGLPLTSVDWRLWEQYEEAVAYEEAERKAESKWFT